MPGDHAVGRSIKKAVFPVAAVMVLLLAGLIYWKAAASFPFAFTADTDGNGQEETYRLDHHRVYVYQDDELLWESPAEWKVTHLLLADADHDGQEEILMVLWKRGSFGSSRPMWLEGPDNDYGNHLFMYRLTSGRMKSVWCSSAIAYPILDLQVIDQDEDGKLELLVTEGPPTGVLYSLRKQFYHNQTLWEWQDWGFMR
jgi:hypothetical protein